MKMFSNKGRPANFKIGTSFLISFSNLACAAFAARVEITGLFIIFSVSCCTFDVNKELIVPQEKVQKELIIEVAGLVEARQQAEERNDDDRLFNVYVFDLDKNANIDSQLQGSCRDGRLTAYSCCGNKLVCLFGKEGKASSLLDGSLIESYTDLVKYAVSDYRSDNPFKPLLSAKRSLSQNADSCSMNLCSCFSKIRLSRLSCDFSGSPFEGECLRNVKIYLTNVSARCPVFGDVPYVTSEILNAGELCVSDLASVMYPEFLCRRLNFPIGKESVNLQMELFCYPNQNREDGIGSPFTRLVIEGEIDGRKTYYPIDVNRGQWNDVRQTAGVGRNVCYDFDVRILREGTTSANAPVSDAEVSVQCIIDEWNEKTEIIETF